MDPENLQNTLAHIFKTGARLLVVLTEEDELPPDAFAMVHAEAARIGLGLAFMPITDFEAPTDNDMYRWHELALHRPDMPDKGGTIAFCCRYGAGRSGTMAAYVLIQCGMDMDDAIALVRHHFDEAIESENQLIWLRKISAQLKDAGG